MLLLVALTSSAFAQAPDWKQLRSETATASSFLASNWNRYTENYHPMYVLDGDPATAWVEGVAGPGEGQRITLPVSLLREPRAIQVRIRNGYQKSRALLNANAAPREVTIRLLDRNAAEVATRRVLLERRLDWQEFVLTGPFSEVAAAELRIETVHAGTKYQDACISDVEVYADSDVPYNAAAEAEKFATAQRWMTERIAVARYHARKPPEDPFATRSFEMADGPPLTVAEADARFAPLRAALEALQAKPTWYRGDPRRTMPLPDATWRLEDAGPVFALANLGFFETTDELAWHRRVAADPDVGGARETWRSNYRVAWRDGVVAQPEAIAFWTKRITEERGTAITEAWNLARYDEQGRITDLYRRGTEVYDEPAQFEEHIAFAADAAGKIHAFEVVTVRHYAPTSTFPTTVTVERYFSP